MELDVGMQFDTKQVLNQFGGIDAKENLFVEFYIGELVSQFTKDDFGNFIRTPKEFVRIRSAGSVDIIDRPVTENDKRRFADLYIKWKDGQRGMDITGQYDLSKWDRLEPAKIAELKSRNFHTVEQLANCSDARLSEIGFDGGQLRKEAQIFLSGHKSATTDDALEAAKAENAEQKKLINELFRRLEALEKPKAKKGKDTE